MAGQCYICGYGECQCSQQNVEDALALCFHLLVDRFGWTEAQVADLLRLLAESFDPSLKELPH